MGIKKVLSTVIAAFISFTAVPFNTVSADSESSPLVWDGKLTAKCLAAHTQNKPHCF